MASTSRRKSRVEIEELRARLAEAEQALEAIRQGYVESFVIETPQGPRIFSLEGVVHSYRVLIERMSEGAATLDAMGVVLYCNARFAEMLNSPLQRVIGTSIFDWVAKRLHGAFANMLRDAAEARRELSLCASGGEEIPALVSIATYEDAGQPVTCLIAADLRQQKRNDEIVASERLTRSVLEQAGNAIVVCDREGAIILANRAAEDLLGRTPVFMSFRAAFPGTIAAAGQPYDFVAAALRGEQVRGASSTVARSDGARLEMLVNADPLHTSGGEVDGCVVTLVDVTTLRRAEEALRDEARRKDEFLGMLSHELRNPLSPIRNCTYILQHASPGSEEARRAQSVIERQTAHLTRLVDDLLDVTRIARGKIELRRSRADLREVVSRAAEDFRVIFLDRGVALRVELPEAGVPVDVDATRITQAVGNLLHNAAKFTARGGDVVLVLSTHDDGTATIRVRDTGVGIEPDLLPRVFEPFVQGDRGLARTDGGLGLGLALVRGVVELHGGSVHASSAGKGKGAEFTIRVPLRTPLAPAPESSDEHRARGGRRVLVVDDNVDAAESLADLVKMLGHSADVAYDGRTAIEKARKNPPNVVLCDIGLPGMDGYEVARALRGMEGMQIVAVSGYAQPEDVKKAVEAGFDAHVAKPCDPAQIERLLG